MIKNIFVKLLICSIFIIVLSTSFCMPSSHALGNIFSDGKAFLQEGKPIDETINTTELEDTSDYIYNALLAFAIMVAIIVAMVLGIQFMVASADEKAKVKEALLPFVVGCIVVFGSFTIWKIVVNIGNDAEDSVRASQQSTSSGTTHGGGRWFFWWRKHNTSIIFWCNTWWRRWIFLEDIKEFI